MVWQANNPGNRLGNTLKRWLAFLAAVVMAGMFSPASADEYPFLGQSFPDFEARDTNRNVFSLSEALESHDAVLINLWTSWCGPCRREFPLLNEVYERYGDRVAFIGMTVDPEDDWNTLFMMEKQYGIAYPVAKEAGTGILEYLGSSPGTPATIIVDRFGNAGFVRVGAFADSASLSRVLDMFLGDGYTEPVTLAGIPMPSETRALPLSSSRRMWVENEDARRIRLCFQYMDPEQRDVFGDEWIDGWLVPGETARLAMEISAGDDLTDMEFFDQNHDFFCDMFPLLDEKRNLYTYALSLAKQPLKDAWCWVSLGTGTHRLDLDPDFIEMCLFPDEESIREMVDYYREEGEAIVTWEYADKGENPEPALPQSWILHAVDQYGEAVPGVAVGFCTDQACVSVVSDENGVAAFTGEPADYHVRVLKVPEGCSFDPDFELRTGAGFGEWFLLVRRD